MRLYSSTTIPPFLSSFISSFCNAQIIWCEQLALHRVCDSRNYHLRNTISVGAPAQQEMQAVPQCTPLFSVARPTAADSRNLKRAHLQPNFPRVGVPARAKHHDARSAGPRLAALLIVHSVQTILALLNPVPSNFLVSARMQSPAADLQLLRKAKVSTLPGHLLKIFNRENECCRNGRQAATW